MGQIDAAMDIMEECGRVRLRESELTAGEVMAWAARELKFHGHRRESEELAVRAAEWYDLHAGGLDLSDREADDLLSYSRALRGAGRWGEASAPLLELQKRGYRPIEVSGTLGLIAAHDGNHDEALRIFNVLPDSDVPSELSGRSYRRACIAAYLGEEDRAIDLLRRAQAEGYYIVSYWLHTDIDLEPLWDNTEFLELMEPKG